MTALACALYLLGAFGACCLVSRDAPLGPREFVAIAAWPVAVVLAVLWGLADFLIRGRARP